MWADVQKFTIPPEFLSGMTEAHAGPGVCQYKFNEFDDDDDLHSAWIFKFYERTPFFGIVFRSREARARIEQGDTHTMDAG